MRLLSLLPRILAIFLLILPPLVAYSQPKLMQGCDFDMTFYPVGAMVAAGQAANIYPPAGLTSFVDAPFNLFVHKILTSVPANYVGIYMYSPLVAAVFMPFSYLPIIWSLILWQVLTIAVLPLVAWLLADGDRKKTIDYFFMMALFCPVFHTLLIGHLGVMLGLLPLALGYYLWTKNRDLAAGFVWGFLAFKPQFLPAAMLVAGALLFAKRPKMTVGLVLGLIAFTAMSMLALGPEIFMSWMHSFKMSDSIFSNPAYGFPAYMVVSLPAVLMQCFPHALRAGAKLPIYGLAAVIGLYTLWQAICVLRPADGGERAKALVMSLGLLVLPLVLPHFLFYDLCGLAMFCALAYGSFWVEAEAGVMRAVRRLLWWGCNLFYIGFMFGSFATPMGHWYALILIVLFGVLYYRVLNLCSSKKQ